jgi:hypothetical protein
VFQLKDSSYHRLLLHAVAQYHGFHSKASLCFSCTICSSASYIVVRVRRLRVGGSRSCRVHAEAVGTVSRSSRFGGQIMKPRCLSWDTYTYCTMTKQMLTT